MHPSRLVSGLSEFPAKRGEYDLTEPGKTEQAITLAAARLTQSMFSSFLSPPAITHLCWKVPSDRMQMDD